MIRFFWIACLAMLMSHLSFSQRLNRFNKKGERTGKWLVYNDSTRTLKSTEGRYRNGDPKGRFYYYTPDGVLERREISRFKKIKTVFYYPDKTIRCRGKARIENLPDKIHYYFYGKWKHYDEKGTLIKYCYYEKGALIKTVYVDKHNKTNDSLVFALNEMDRFFREKNSDLLDSIFRCGFNIRKREQLQEKLYQNDTLTFHKLDLILFRYGYPSKERASDSGIIPFYILSYAPVDVREKYLPQLMFAANAGDLEWKTLAFFIDKLKVAKGEKQVYGTQHYFLKNEVIDYPVDDLGHLDERRKSVGL